LRSRVLGRPARTVVFRVDPLGEAVAIEVAHRFVGVGHAVGVRVLVEVVGETVAVGVGLPLDVGLDPVPVVVLVEEVRCAVPIRVGGDRSRPELLAVGEAVPVRVVAPGVGAERPLRAVVEAVAVWVGAVSVPVVPVVPVHVPVAVDVRVCRRVLRGREATVTVVVVVESVGLRVGNPRQGVADMTR
jgi:hypothetical protein